MELKILYQDDLLVAIDKPPGLLVHRTRIDRYETRFAMQMLRDQIRQRVYLIHRLDKPTSGVLLFSLDADTARSMSEQFSQRTVDKEYLAIVRGHTADFGSIDKPLRELYDPATDRLARFNKEEQHALTDYETLARAVLPYPVGPYSTSRYSLLRLIPHTGRRHQIRRHLNHISHPVIGDVNHGDRHHNRFFRQHFDCHRLMLMARSLEITHPVAGERIRIESSLDEDFRRLISAMDLDYPL